MPATTRRGFMVGCSAAIAAFTGGLTYTAFGSPNDEPNHDILLDRFSAWRDGWPQRGCAHRGSGPRLL